MVFMVMAKLLSSEGPYLEAVVEVHGQRLCVMDALDVGAGVAPQPGEVFDLAFGVLDDDDETWEQMFAANPEGRQCLVPLGGWRYRAYGRVVGVQPVVVDCGVLQVEDVVNSQDPALLGATLAFTIARLDAYMAGT